MAFSKSILVLAAVLQAALVPVAAQAASPDKALEVVKIWPGPAPGTEDWTGPETDTPLKLPGAAPISMVSNVTVPTLTVYRPAPGTANGTAMIVVPGGGFQTLAVTHEGDMVARWLADRGITAFMLKYRVRTIPGYKMPMDLRQHPERFQAFAHSFEPGRARAYADATQAIRFLRTNAARLGVAPDRIGMIGFSAGAIITMAMVTNESPVDRPNFAAPIYGALLDGNPPADGPPLFIAAAEDDNAVPVGESIAIFSRWNGAHLPAELHVYDTGGHGFGMMTKHKPVDGWTGALEAWMRSHGWIGMAKRP